MQENMEITDLNNEELKNLFHEDQAERTGNNSLDELSQIFIINDVDRRNKVRELLLANRVNTNFYSS